MAVNKENVKIQVSHMKKSYGKLEVLKDDGSSTEPVPAPAEPDDFVDAQDIDMPF